MGLAGLEGRDITHVLIHDGVRPFIPAGLIDRVVDGLRSDDAVLPARPVADTLKRVGAAGTVTGTVPREGLWAAETPQGFRIGPIRAAHENAAAAGLSFTDDAAVAEWAGLPVRVVGGAHGNLKLTTPEDLAMAERLLAGRPSAGRDETRVGIGYDVHAFGPGDGVMLGGVRIPHDRALSGHSDADVALHALTDAILGALADGDIGVHFPPGDPRWKAAASELFVSNAVARLRRRGGSIVHIDLALIAEAPKIGPWRDAIRRRIAEICGTGAGRVSIKATTSEGLGFVGRREGIAAIATATIRLPDGGDG